MEKDKRSSYTAAFKRKVIWYADQHGNRAAGREYQVHEKCVRRWKLQRVSIFKCLSTKKCFRGPKRGHHPEMEEELVEFIRSQRNQGFPVTSAIIQVKARELARARGIPHATFRASRGWVDRLMRRHGFSLRRRTTIAQKLPADFEHKVVQFQRHVIALRKSRNFLMGQIGNADQTPVFFDMPSNYTINEKGAKQVRIRTTGGEKMR